jgi:leader peptidase (prepilin peptidase)/N-methyltransferase
MIDNASFEAVTGAPELFGYIAVFAIGAVIGSFLNVVIHRVPREQSIVFPNSACPGCGVPIKPYDNVPILSWLLLGGKCRNCKQPISGRYPAVEFLTAVVFVVVFWQVGFTPFLPVALAFAATMISLIFIDAEHMILPNVITYPLFIFAILARALFPIFFGAAFFPDISQAPINAMNGYPTGMLSLTAAALGALAGGGSLWLVGAIWKKVRGVDAMGLGDVKMMLGVGALLGWRLSILSIFLSAFAGAVIGSILILRQKDKNMQSHIPYGIFLGIGSLMSLLFGERLITWYLHTFIR